MKNLFAIFILDLLGKKITCSFFGFFFVWKRINLMNIIFKKKTMAIVNGLLLLNMLKFKYIFLLHCNIKHSLNLELLKILNNRIQNKIFWKWRKLNHISILISKIHHKCSIFTHQYPPSLSSCTLWLIMACLVGWFNLFIFVKILKFF